MTQLVVLSEKERALFDLPPKFNTSERIVYLTLEQKVLDILQSIRTTTNKVGFMLQYGYFRSNGKFYPTEQFKQQDINYIAHQLNLDPNDINIEKYQKKNT